MSGPAILVNWLGEDGEDGHREIVDLARCRAPTEETNPGVMIDLLSAEYAAAAARRRTP